MALQMQINMLELRGSLLKLVQRLLGKQNDSPTCLNALLTDSAASVATIAALSLAGLIGFGALALDVNRALEEQVRNQMVADAAALSSAMAYSASGNTSTVINPTAQDVAVANGLASTTTTATTVADYPTSGNNAVKATVRTSVPFSLAAIFNSGSSFSIVATAYAHLPGTTASAVSPCFLALSSGSSAIATSGGATIAAPTCDVAAVGNISLASTGVSVNNLVSGSGAVSNSFGYVTANLLNYSTSWTNPGWNTAIPASSKIVQKTTTLGDGLAGNSDIATARALLGTYTAPNTMSNPSSSACSSASAGSFSTNQTLATGTYNYSTLTISGTAVVTYGNGSTINICGGFTSSGSAKINFGNSTVNVNGGFVIGGSGGSSMGNGNLSIGSGGTVSFSGTNTIGDGTVSINNDVTITGGSNLTIGTGNHSFKSLAVNGTYLKMGAGDLDVTAGITTNGSSTVAADAGNYRLGPKSSTNECINLAGSANFFMGNGTFSCNGKITTSGGSHLVFGAATNHYITGNMTIAGSALFGAGAYIINGNFTNGTGGTTWPYTSSVTGTTYGSAYGSGYDMAGINVTFILGGSLQLAGGAKTKLTAPTSTTSGGAIADILFDSQTSAATNWIAGANSSFSGVVHLPNSAVTMSGGTATTSGGCFMLTANTITLSGGATTASACTSVTTLGSSSSETSSSISLVG